MEFVRDPSLVLYLPLFQMDGASLMSQDAYGHSCSVTGALWRPAGRLFDGVDDQILKAASLTEISKDLAYTIEIWLKILKATVRQTIFANSLGANDRTFIGINSATPKGLSFQQYDGAVTTGQGQDNWTDTTNFHHFVALSDGAKNYSAYIDNVLQVGGNYAGGDGGAGCILGRDVTGVWPFEGYIGECRIYSRALNLLEIQCNYLATKWRYQ